MKKSFAEILTGLDEGTGKKVKKKIPAWEGAVIPSALSLEQCSSQAAAEYKCRLLKRFFPKGPNSVCDLTCGLGVDSLAFSKIAGKVTSFERSETLADAARGNFLNFGAGNIEVRREEVGPATDFPACDVFYADPARRDVSGHKVFRLEDCSPDIKPLIPLLLAKSSMVLLKLSPMADISLLAGTFGQKLREIHIVSLHSEVKELLCVLSPENTDMYAVNAVELDAPEEAFCFRPEEEKHARAEYAEEATAGQYLHEPCPGLLKSGAFHLMGERFGFKEADRSTRLYLADHPVRSHLMRTFMIEHVLPLSNAGIKEARGLYPEASVSARNIPAGSEALRRKLGAGESRERHIFGCSVAGRRMLLLCRRFPEQMPGPENMV